MIKKIYGWEISTGERFFKEEEAFFAEFRAIKHGLKLLISQLQWRDESFAATQKNLKKSFEDMIVLKDQYNERFKQLSMGLVEFEDFLKETHVKEGTD